MPRYLTEKDIADFRAELCRVATERFARFGYEGVTMRQLAEALGCSPKTPYRYFKDKADILATVRAQAFARFADALEAAAAKGETPQDRARRVGEAYLRFAADDPHAYRIMFEIDQPVDKEHPDLAREAHRARGFITRQAEDMAKAGMIDVDPVLFGWSIWAATHGLVMLRQAGMFDSGPDFGTLASFQGALMFKGAAKASNMFKEAIKAPNKTGRK
ncbi:TetR/AcrR family transcriptional regulator [Reyranella sp.]|uniref:TetR/AcrR family transcriptional regulator n=1 Tax=Reyranella sp. TaxID=1929291 RepID=UPI001203F409|nr:TetR/AcrR family transcriptional regulator [Reyranella sp.]TAJ83285.1 MAG: TetR/AcrR family transcriptional regulator [Reyranella sp.]